jgi:hypothetical protein
VTPESLSRPGAVSGKSSTSVRRSGLRVGLDASALLLLGNNEPCATRPADVPKPSRQDGSRYGGKGVGGQAARAPRQTQGPDDVTASMPSPPRILMLSLHGYVAIWGR